LQHFRWVRGRGYVDPVEVRKAKVRSSELFDEATLERFSKSRPRCQCSPSCGGQGWPWWPYAKGHHLRRGAFEVFELYSATRSELQARTSNAETGIDAATWRERAVGLDARRADALSGKIDQSRFVGDCTMLALLTQDHSWAEIAEQLGTGATRQNVRQRVMALERLGAATCKIDNME
jgi:hypothetical protein